MGNQKVQARGAPRPRSATPMIETDYVIQCSNAILVLSPEHYGIFRDAGWDRSHIEAALHEATVRPGSEIVQGAGGVGEGMGAEYADGEWPKFWRDHGLLVVRAGGSARLFSAIIGGWIGGRNRDVVQPVTKEIDL